MGEIRVRKLRGEEIHTVRGQLASNPSVRGQRDFADPEIRTRMERIIVIRHRHLHHHSTSTTEGHKHPTRRVRMNTYSDEGAGQRRRGEAPAKDVR